MDNQVTKAWIDDVTVDENGNVLLDVATNFETSTQLVIIERESKQKLFCEGTKNGLATGYQLPTWVEITALFLKSVNAKYILDFYVATEDASELVRINFDATHALNEKLLFAQSGEDNFIYRPYATIKDKFSIEVDYIPNDFENTSEQRTLVLKQVDRLAKKYFLHKESELSEIENLVSIKKPLKVETESKLVSQVIALAETNNYQFVASDFLATESQKILAERLGNRVVFHGVADASYYQLLAGAKYEYSLEDEFRLNPIRDTGVLVKEVTLAEYKKNKDGFKLKINIRLHDEQQCIESVKLELRDEDSGFSHRFETNQLDVNTKTVIFNLNVNDFKSLIDLERWVGFGLVSTRIFVSLQGKPVPTFGNLITKAKNMKLDADFSIPETKKKSFVIAPCFIKDAGLNFGTSIIETEILSEYILAEEDVRMPVMKRAKRRLANYYANQYDTTKLDKNIVLYETRSGRSITCSPYAIFKYLISNPQYAHLKHYWVVKEELLSEITASMPPELLEKMVLVVKESKAHFDLLLTAKYIIVNGSCLQPPFRKKKGQIITNTWHGIPIKYMAFDTPAVNIPRFRNILRQFMALDYLISPNEHTTKVMTKAYKLHGLFQGEILEYGYPRMDVTVNSNKNDYHCSPLAELTIDQSKPNLVYMPTWRGVTTKEAMQGVEFLVQEVMQIKEQLSDQYNVLVKVHPFLFEYVKADLRLKGTLISDYCDPNEVLSMTDVMIADYSSVFFDFLPTKKPIVFYMKDRHEYENDRGLYISPDDLPGAIVYTTDELVASLETLAQTDLRDETGVRNEFITTYSTYDDGFATKRIVERIFKGIKPEVGRTLKLANKKKKVLIKLETLDDHDLFNNYQALTKQIDFERFDVTHLSGLDGDWCDNSALVDPRIRQMFDTGTKLFTVEEQVLMRHYENNDAHNIGKMLDNIRLAKAHWREDSRLVPLDAFDYIIEFDQNSPIDFERLLTKRESLLASLVRTILMKRIENHE